MRLGSGFRYLMDSVAAGDGAAPAGSGLTRYYAESGTPPGIFLGSGLAGLGRGRGIQPGSEVTEEHLWRMLGTMCDPLDGEPLGTVPRAGTSLSAVAGFDLTFSPSKSISTAWALANEPTRRVIYDCHRRAIDFVLAYGEREMFHSRSGTNGIVQEDIEGVIATSFTHWDNRSGDPQLHDHVVVWNRARSLSDGRWRTLDSRGLYKSVVALSEMHQGVLADYLTEALGVGWDARSRRHSPTPRWEIAGVGEVLLSEFSQRSEQVETEKERLVAQFVTSIGRQPTASEVMDMRRKATVTTRPAKEHRRLPEMTAAWRERAEPHVGNQPEAWVASLRGRNDLPLLRASDLAGGMLTDAARAVTTAVADRRSVYSRANLLAEAHRLLQGVRFAEPGERVSAAEAVVDVAVAESLELTAPEICHTPARLRRSDGTSRLRAKGHEAYTTRHLLDAEARLLRSGRDVAGPAVPPAAVEAESGRVLPGREFTLSNDQAAAVSAIAASGRRLDVLVGPAGTGKSTTMAGLRTVWEAAHGPASVIGLAPSAAAAEVLADELGIETENTVKWLAEHSRLPERLAMIERLQRQVAGGGVMSSSVRRRLDQLEQEVSRWQLRPGQLVIVDEATLAGTFALDRLASAAADAGAKLLLVGDWAQLSGVEAGGAFHLLCRDRGELVPELTGVRRFAHGWEKEASKDLRLGRQSAIETYEAKGRVHEGDRTAMLDSIYRAWTSDRAVGLNSLMVSVDSATVSELNARARSDLLATGAVSGHGVAVADGQTAGPGDQVVTRQNDRHLQQGGRWVKNGDRWIVTGTGEDGSMTVRSASGARLVALPASYVREHVELGYATTVHRAQGRNVDTCHALATAVTSREALYVAATRGRHANHIYVDTSYDPDPGTSHDQTAPVETGRSVLARVLANEGGDLSAHETLRRALRHAESWATLAAEYQTIAAIAQADRWDDLISRAGLSLAQVERIRTSPSTGALHAALREAESLGLDVDGAVPALVRARMPADTSDPAAVLHGRIDRWIESARASQRGATRPPSLIGGLIPKTQAITDPDLARALDDREQALQRRARELAATAITTRPVWLRRVGAPPQDPPLRASWERAVATIAAYRDRWALEHDESPLGPKDTTSLEQLRQRSLAEQALARALRLSASATPRSPATVASNPTMEPRGPDL